MCSGHLFKCVFSGCVCVCKRERKRERESAMCGMMFSFRGELVGQ